MAGDRDLARQKPTFWKRPVELKFGKLAVALAKVGIGASMQKWPVAAMGARDLLKAVGLKPEEPEVVAWLLVQRALLLAAIQLAKETNSKIDFDIQQLGKHIDFALDKEELFLPYDFIRSAHPKNLELLKSVRIPYKRWLIIHEISNVQAENLVQRLPSYFVFALHEEWSSKSKDYAVLTQQEDTPFADFRADELAWGRYLTRLQKRVNESMLGEDFGLESVYIPLRGYYEKVKTKDEKVGDKRKRVAIDLYDHLSAWADNTGQQDAIRLIRGGPGSGKSSFCKMLAARLAEDETKRVLFVTLYHFGLTEDFGDALAKFMEDEGLSRGLLAKDNPERVLLILDGLDELAMQGKTSARVARDFIEKVQRYVNNKNQQLAQNSLMQTRRKAFL